MRNITVTIFGANGFIGQHLVRRILETTKWRVVATDLADNHLKAFKGNPRYEFHKGNIFNVSFVRKLVAKGNVIVPLAGIATPKTYILDPIKVYELDFEANLVIVRLCVELKKRLVWPSTSEVYGMSTDKEFHPEESNLVMGPISKTRWIYAAGKQLIDRIIVAYGRDRGLEYSIFRPFNWIGYGQDNIRDTKGNARLVTQFLGNVLRGENLALVDGGTNRRSFTHIDDAVDALVKIIENKGGVASGKIYNIGNPKNNHSIKDVAETILALAPKYPHFREGAKKAKMTRLPSRKHYGEGYQDMMNRTPYIKNIVKDLSWKPKIHLREALKRTMNAYEAELSGSDA